MSPSERGCAAILAGRAPMGPRALGQQLDRWGAVAVCAGVTRHLPPSPETDPDAVAARHDQAGVAILLRTDAAYPAALVEDVLPPPVLFAQGDLASLDGPCVAIIGTRRCTGAGAAVARSLGRDLAEEGVAVVSGLALGIDGAAHRGVLDSETGPGRPIGVIACGHDVPYPSRHASLWASVAERGVLLGEVPLGTRPATWRFPQRNRIIAALADLVVVVESHVAGGSLLTVREAIVRGIDVMAVPGSVRNAAAAGTNQLIAEGCHPVRDAHDVVMALGLTTVRREARHQSRPHPDAEGRAVLDAFDWEPATLEHLALRTGRGVPELALALHHLEVGGWVTAQGPWYERVERG